MIPTWSSLSALPVARPAWARCTAPGCAAGSPWLRGGAQHVGWRGFAARQTVYVLGKAASYACLAMLVALAGSRLGLGPSPIGACRGRRLQPGTGDRDHPGGRGPDRHGRGPPRNEIACSACDNCDLRANWPPSCGPSSKVYELYRVPPRPSAPAFSTASCPAVCPGALSSWPAARVRSSQGSGALLFGLATGSRADRGRPGAAGPLTCNPRATRASWSASLCSCSAR